MSGKIVVALLAFVASAVFGTQSCVGQAKSKDEELDKFLQKLDGARKADTPAPSKDAKPGVGAKAKPGAETGTKKDDVAPNDKDLDNFLEKLGEVKETPSPDEPPSGLPKPGNEPPSQPDKPKANDLKGEANELDKHLEELTGRRRKKKNPDDGEGSGPLGKIIKEMRDVEERLGKPDTGEGTRKKQAEIVKQLDQVIEQLKSMPPSQSRRKTRLVMKPGQKSGQQQPGEQVGSTGGKAAVSKAQKPNNKRSMAGGKDEWGHLPAELRQDLENTFGKEESLAKRQALIDRYFDSLSKKTLVRGE